MIDVMIVMVLIGVFSFTMRKHGMWMPIRDAGDFVAWLMVSFIALCLIRFPIYLMVYGFHVPFDASPAVQVLTGIAAIVFWFCMLYWRIPKRLLGRK